MTSETSPLVEQHSHSELAPPPNLRYILCSLWTSSFLAAADTTIVATTANAIASSMNGSDKIAWIASSYLLTNAIFQPLVGKVSDVFGRRSVFIGAQIWFGLGCVCCALSPNVTAFSVSRAIAGVGGGGISPLCSIIMTDVVPMHQRAMYQGYANLIYASGQFIGPVVGSLFLTLDENSGWRWMFGMQVPLVLVTIFLAHRYVHEYRFNAEERTKNRSFSSLKQIDLPGSFTLALSITSVLILFQSTTKIQAEVRSLACVISITSFSLVERYLATSHVIPLSAFQGILCISSLIAFFGTMAIFSMNFLIPLYLQIVHDFSSLQLGVFNALGIILSAGGSLLGGWLLKSKTRLEPREMIRRAVNVSIFGCVCIFTGTVFSAVIMITYAPTISRADISYPKMALLAITSRALAALGYGVFLVSVLILVVGKMGMKNQATGTGMSYMFRSMGGVCGVGTSLGMYNLLLETKLRKYLVDKENGQLLLERLMKSSFYIRNGMPAQYLARVLALYRSSFGDSMTLVSVMGTLTLVLALLMILYEREARPSRSPLD